MMALLKTIATLGLLLIAFPINLTIVFLSLIIRWIMTPFASRKVAKNPKKVLLTGAKMTKCKNLYKYMITSFSKSPNICSCGYPTHVILTN